MTEWLRTQRLHAKVTFAEGFSIEGDLHLQPSSALRHGIETPLEMLNRPEHFFAMTLPSGDATLVSKSQTAVVACSMEVAETDPERQAVARSAELEVHLSGGKDLHGTAQWELPQTNSRTLDFLNSADGFFSLTDGETAWYVNRAQVRHVYPKD